MAKPLAAEDSEGWAQVRLGGVDSAAPQLQVSNVFVRALAEVVQQHGIAIEALLGQTADGVLDGPAEGMLSLAELQLLLARAIRLTRQPALGLYWGQHASSFGLLSTLVAHAPTLRQAIGLISQFHPLVAEAWRVELVERAGVARLTVEILPGNGALDRTIVEMVLSGLVRMLKAFGYARGDIRSVCFEYAPPAHCAAYAVVFAGAERFSQPFTGVEFSSHALDRPHVHHDLELHALMLAQAERNLDQRSRPLRCADRVRVILSSAPVAKLPDMLAISRKLGISVRSLRRRLDEEGTSYRELTQSVLHESACSMLRNPDLTLQSIAHALGFADSTGFHRAFQRWASVTPAEYRASLSGLTGRLRSAAASKG